jgi:hypothetical protein
MPARQPPPILVPATNAPVAAKCKPRISKLIIAGSIVGGLLVVTIAAMVAWFVFPQWSVSRKLHAFVSPAVVVRVGDWRITLDEFNRQIEYVKKTVPEFDDKDAASKRRILEEVVKQQLVVHDARDQDLHKTKGIIDATKAFQDKIRARNDPGINIAEATRDFEDQLLIEEYVKRLTKDVPDAPEAVARAYYERNVGEFVESDGVKVAFAEIRSDLIGALTRQEKAKVMADKLNEIRKRVVTETHPELLGPPAQGGKTPIGTADITTSTDAGLVARSTVARPPINSPPYAKIIGTWSYSTKQQVQTGTMKDGKAYMDSTAEISFTHTMSYSEDYKWIMKEGVNGRNRSVVTVTAAGDWTIEGDTLICTVKTCSNDSLTTMKAKSVVSCRIVKVDASTLILKGSDETVTWHRGE